MMPRATRYRCRCGATKCVPEDPLAPSPTIRTGCQSCERIATHRPVGTVHAWSYQ